MRDPPTPKSLNRLRGEVSTTSRFGPVRLAPNGGNNGSGILWLTGGDHSQSDVPGTLYAVDALDLTNLLLISDMNADRDRMGGFAKFATPTVADGRVYVPSFSNSVAVYGLLPQADAQTESVLPAPAKNGQIGHQHRERAAGGVRQPY